MDALKRKIMDEKYYQSRIALLEQDLGKAKEILGELRAYYGATPGWDMYEDEVNALIGRPKVEKLWVDANEISNILEFRQRMKDGENHGTE